MAERNQTNPAIVPKKEQVHNIWASNRPQRGSKFIDVVRVNLVTYTIGIRASVLLPAIFFFCIDNKQFFEGEFMALIGFR